MKNHDEYYFEIDVREGAPGCADDATYTSRAFRSFATAYEELIFFEFERYWPHLRRIQRVYIWRRDHPKVNADAVSTELIELGVTEDEFDAIIEHVNRRLRLRGCFLYRE